jgi:hypothetical protein
MFKSMIGAMAAVAIAAMPVTASAAPANPAASLSVAKSVRASTPTAKNSKFAGGAIFAVLILAGVVAIVAIGSSKDNKAKSP